MNHYSPQGAHSNYQVTGIQTAAEGANPHRLIAMLFDRALAKIAIAKGHMHRGQISEKGVNVSGAMAIIDGLRACLDIEAGGTMAQDLDNLYEYMSRRLLEANLNNDVSILEEVSDLVREIRSAWVAIEDQVEGGKKFTVPA